MIVVGIDLSLSSTGLAFDGTTCTVAAPPDDRGRPGDTLAWRCVTLRSNISTAFRDHIAGAAAWPDLVVIEDLPSARLAGAGAAVAALGVAHGVVRSWLWVGGVKVVLVQPATLKKFATGKGNAPKDLVRDAARDRGGLPAGVTSDECDAWWLRQIGLHLVGDPGAVAVPKTHMSALDRLR